MRSLVLLITLLAGCRPPADSPVRVTYWEKWSGTEAAAMQAVVDQFNQSQDRIVVEFLSLSNVDRKTIVATAGGDPPDVAGLWLNNVYSFADRNALTPLDEFMADTNWLARYVPVYADMCRYRDRTWAVVSAAAVTGLHWNKRLFREAGLDPDRPPRTRAELDEYAAKLTKRDPQTGAITQLGFLPQEPNWFVWAYPQWFGGRYWDGQAITLAGQTEWLRWVESYSRRYGLEQIKTFSSGFGNFNSPQNPFLAGKVAMVVQGVWMNSFIERFAPGLEYGVAAWPAEQPGFAMADADLLVIPRGAKHPREAWEFIQFVASHNPHAKSRDELRGGELLCFLQQKNSPLRDWSPFFTTQHPHPHIRVFRQLAESPNAIHIPKLGIWEEYRRELLMAFDAVRLLTRTPEEAVAFADERMRASWELHRRSLERRR
ncbi:MAG: hypothetical protein PCFJNLEI_00279 [Verrucomicrobiae bacterium]|nr:hypothetical protein [Verrucomicrobiae bacterium]